MKKRLVFSAFLLTLLFVVSLPAQQPTPTPADEPVKIRTDEVHLNVTAQTSYGRFVPTLKADDLLVVEEGTPQTITSMKQIPASVLLLLDTGGNLNFVKSTKLTGLTAKTLIDHLSAGDAVAVTQYNDKIETVSDWTNDREVVYEAITKKLFPGRRSRYADALNAAIASFKSRPLENRHLVLISDGLETVADHAAVHKAMQNLLAANITVHIISYTTLEANAGQKASKTVRIGKGDTKPRVPKEIFDANAKAAFPGYNSSKRALEQVEFLKAVNEGQRLVIIDLDKTRIKLIRNKVETLRTSETKMQQLADDTGGLFQAPEELETMWKFAAEIAGAVDSQYAITYMPTKPFIDAAPDETRKVRVSTHCDGVQIRSRQKIVFSPEGIY